MEEMDGEKPSPNRAAGAVHTGGPLPLSNQRLVLDPVGLERILAELSPHPVLVLGVAALEPTDGRVALEGEMWVHTRSRNHLSCEITGRTRGTPQAPPRGAQCVDVEVVGGLVQQHDVAAPPQHGAEVDPVCAPPDREPTFFC